MAEVKTPARHWGIEVESATAGTWIEVGGLTSVGWDRSVSAEDTGDFQSDGWSEDMVLERGRSMSLEGRYLTDITSGLTLGDRDPGQLRIEALSDVIGPAAEGRVRITDPAGDVWTQRAHFNGGPTIGDKGAISGWSAEISLQGAPTYTPVV